MPAQIQSSTFKFLRDIRKNNNRNWFNDNKLKYQSARENVKEFLTALESEMNKFDEIEKTKLFRIYRDVRFSKDKTPYNSHFSMSLSRAGHFRRGGYFLKVTPGNTHIAGGFWAPNPRDMKLIRDHISTDPKPLRKIINSKSFKDTFGTLIGEQVKTAPKGYSKDDPAIDLLRYKQLFVSKKIPDKHVTAPTFLKEVVSTYKKMEPFFNYMTDILTHDLNGVPLYK